MKKEHKISILKLPGLIKEFQSDFLLTYYNLYINYGSRVTLPKPFEMTLLYHPEDIEKVLVKRSDHFIKGDTYKELIPVMGKGLLLTNGKTWQESRKKMGSFFTQKSLLILEKIFENELDKWLDSLPEICDFNVEFHKFILHLIVKILFETDEKIDLEKPLKDFFESFLKRIYTLFPSPIWYPSKNNLMLKKSGKKILSEYRNICKSSSDDSFYQKYLIDRKNRIQVQDDLITLIIAGHETTANALTWLVYRMITFDKFNTCDLDLFIKETLRLHPPVIRMNRNVIKEIDLGNMVLPKKREIGINIWVTHRHKEFWNNPEVFNPNRFKEHIGSSQYLPFGLGKRRCIGEKLAIAQINKILIALLKKYKITKIDDKIIPYPAITLGFKKGPIVKLKRI